MFIRFNNAPTDEFSKDVGRKTTIRIVNSQVVAKPHFKFLESKIFSNQIVIVWDPSAYKVIFIFFNSKIIFIFLNGLFTYKKQNPRRKQF